MSLYLDNASFISLGARSKGWSFSSSSSICFFVDFLCLNQSHTKAITWAYLEKTHLRLKGFCQVDWSQRLSMGLDLSEPTQGRP